MSTVRTPPGTTLSTPSPTESSRSMPDIVDDMSLRSQPIYLIVATSINPPLGIGLRNNLPWGPIRTDMSFFQKVTSGKAKANAETRPNAVVMGRKTWDSIPKKFRPLAGRCNVVVTRSDAKTLASTILDDMNAKASASEESTKTRFELDSTSPSMFAVKAATDTSPTVLVTSSIASALDVEAADIFCIGGSEIYRLVLQDQALRKRLRILQTQVRKLDGSSFECDTFWPEELRYGDEGWQTVQHEQVKDWIGLDVPQGEKEWVEDSKAGVEIRVLGWQQEQ